MHHQTCRFIDDQQVGVFKHHVQDHVFRLEGLALRRWPEFNLHAIASLDLEGSLGHGQTVQAHQA